MPRFRRPAARSSQGNLTLYSTSMPVRDIITEGFYTVETLDPSHLDDKGYQRLLNTARAKRLADYIVKGQDSQDAFLPTSVFLATDKMITHDPADNCIEFSTEEVGPFSVVDGQHRLEGLRLAAEKDPRVLAFEIPINIAVQLPHLHQMCHFLIVNTTQKSVDKSVEQRIVARLSEAVDVEDLPSLPKWILNIVERGEVDRAVRFVDFLNETEGSPWKDRIAMANADTDATTVNQKTFVKAIVKYVLAASNPLSTFNDLEKERRVFLNYWKAIHKCIDDGDATVLYKYNGVELFCKFSTPFFVKLHDRGSFTTDTMEKVLQECLDNLDGEHSGVGHPDFWRRGGKASFMNAGAINQVFAEMTKSA